MAGPLEAGQQVRDTLALPCGGYQATSESLLRLEAEGHLSRDMALRLLAEEPVAMGRAAPPLAQTHTFLAAGADQLSGIQQTTLRPASTSPLALAAAVGAVQGQRGTSTADGRLETLPQQRASMGSQTLAAAVEAEADGEQVEMGVPG